MESVNNFLNEYIFTQGVESRIGQYGNDVVDLINKFIRIIIAFMIVYLIIVKLPDHGDKDHTMYFNLLLLISIFLLVIYIQKNWRKYYINDFLGAADIGPTCAGDLDNVPLTDSTGNSCPKGLEDNGKILIDSVTLAITKELSDWKNYLYLIGIGLLLRQLNYPMYYAAVIFFPFNCLKGIIFFILFASKYSPINFLFGKTGNIEDPFIYGNKISETKENQEETELINFNEKFYVMYIVLILLIFFTIIIRLTSDTIIDCKNFVGPLPIDTLQGCMGYRFYMLLNILLFIGFSTDFLDSLQKISLDNTKLICPSKVDETGNLSPKSKQIYTSREGECLKPEQIIDTPICNTSEQIIECNPTNETPLKGCFIKRYDFDNYNYKLKDVTDYNNNKDDGIDNRIIISKNPNGNGYIIDNRYNQININSSDCKNSIENWLSMQSDDNIFEPINKDIINSLVNLSEEETLTLLKAINDVDSNE